MKVSRATGSMRRVISVTVGVIMAVRSSVPLSTSCPIDDGECANSSLR